MFRLTPIALLVCAAGVLPAAPDAAISQARTALARLPLRFEANQGQAAPEVLYTARAGGSSLFLTGQGAILHPAGAKPVTMNLLRSNRAPEIEALDKLPARTDYFLGGRDRWRTGVAS